MATQSPEPILDERAAARSPTDALDTIGDLDPNSTYARLGERDGIGDEGDNGASTPSYSPIRTAHAGDGDGGQSDGRCDNGVRVIGTWVQPIPTSGAATENSFRRKRDVKGRRTSPTQTPLRRPSRAGNGLVPSLRFGSFLQRAPDRVRAHPELPGDNGRLHTGLDGSADGTDAGRGQGRSPGPRRGLAPSGPLISRVSRRRQQAPLFQFLGDRRRQL